jgi:hypothetical protein
LDNDKNENTAIDAGQSAKRDAVKSARSSLLSKLLPEIDSREYEEPFANEIEEIAGGVEKGWIAIIHADGNDLGKKIMKMAEEKASSEKFRDMSRRMERATTSAAQIAFDTVLRGSTKQNKYPIRPIVLGGDDLTVIIRGDLALRFTETFLKAFEQETRDQFQGFGFGFDQGLTACAGIAYIKPNYPFHYGADLAETLCGRAKKVAKAFGGERTPSCLQFHKVHASFIEDYESIIAKELTAGKVRLDFGPYFLEPKPGYATVGDLNHWIGMLSKPDSPRSRLRNWLTDLETNSEAAHQQLFRIRQITKDTFVHELRLEKPTQERGEGKKKSIHTHLFDAIALSTIESPQS